MPTSPTPITSLPTAPSRADPANFATRADAFLGALGTFGTQTNALGSTTYNNAVDSADSATAAGTSAGNAATSASNAAASATAAAGSATAAANSATSAAASYDAFDDRYLGSKASDPSVDNDGNALLTGALYWNTSANEMRVWNGAAWVVSYLPAGAYLQLTGGTLSGNLGLGVTPRAWAGGYKSFDITGPGAIASTASGDTFTQVANGAWFNGTNWIYQYTGVGAARYQMTGPLGGGNHSWHVAASGTAGNAISFTQAMTLDASGALGIGVTSPTSRLTIGSGSFSAAGTTTSGLYTDASLGLVALTDGLYVATRGGSGRFQIDPSGNVIAGRSVALATTATDGFLYVPTCAGTPTGTPTAITGMAPIVVNTTNNKLYFYSGGAWRDAGP
jgi:hypothetical protein